MIRIALGLVGAAVVAVLGYLGYRLLAGGPEPPKLPALERLLADRAVAAAVASLEIPKDLDTVALPPLEGPLGPEVTKILRARLDEAGRVKLTEAASLKKDHPGLSRFIDGVFGGAAGRWADKAWKDAGVHAFLRGDATFADRDGQTVLTVSLRLEDSASGEVVARAERAEAIRRSLLDLDYYRLAVGGVGGGWRLLLWLALTLGLPLATYPVAKRLLEREKNAVNVATWLGYTGADVGAALALTGFETPGFLGTVMLLLALGLSLFYNYGILTEIEDLRR
ncbi:MAG: hypothetical protein L0216_03115 [Planctomycetales bacterium]|nr:hypothetical protein [Planctomycetales bacterium]